MGKCLRCNRPLSDPKSIEREYGPVCWGRKQAEDRIQEIEEEDNVILLDDPIEDGIICYRLGEHTSDSVATNIRWLVKDHSPTGFNWGYGGSGPADFALNIIENILRHEKWNGKTTNDVWDKSTIFKASYALHQPFKRDFVAGIPVEGGRIDYQVAKDWIFDNINSLEIS